MMSIPLSRNVEWHAWRAGKRNQHTAHKSTTWTSTCETSVFLVPTFGAHSTASNASLNARQRTPRLAKRDHSTCVAHSTRTQWALHARSALNALQNGKYSAIAECRVFTAWMVSVLRQLADHVKEISSQPINSYCLLIIIGKIICVSCFLKY